MPECHRCQHNGTESPACLKCRGPAETNHKGRVFVSLDSGEKRQTGAEVEAAMQVAAYEPPDVEVVALPDCCLDTARRLLGVLLELEDDDLHLLRHRLAGGTLADFGGDVEITRQGAHARWNRIVARHTELAAVFPKMRKT